MQYTFERYEKKYFLTEEQRQSLLEQLKDTVKQDEYGKTTICNVYYDTEDWELIRTSIEKPTYKEKFRVRSYGVPKDDGLVFAEIKKKCKGIVYKRRISGKNCEIREMLLGKRDFTGQIGSEIEWFRDRYRIFPRMYIAYDRVAYYGDGGLRITFDTDIRFRTDNLDLTCGDGGERLFNEKKVLAEIKIPGACPLQLSHILSQENIFPVSFSKYGECFKKYTENKGEIICA